MRKGILVLVVVILLGVIAALVVNSRETPAFTTMKANETAVLFEPSVIDRYILGGIPRSWAWFWKTRDKIFPRHPVTLHLRILEVDRTPVEAARALNLTDVHETPAGIYVSLVASKAEPQPMIAKSREIAGLGMSLGEDIESTLSTSASMGDRLLNLPDTGINIRCRVFKVTESKVDFAVRPTLSALNPVAASKVVNPPVDIDFGARLNLSKGATAVLFTQSNNSTNRTAVVMISW